ncbi:MAG TPA: hypothetical protein VHA52_09730 [Candidatus Babeliaceae bacterium]|nr:hypothetical protein [Candidatus Babeliaceae bacterium]
MKLISGLKVKIGILLAISGFQGCLQAQNPIYNIGLCIVGTGSYNAFAQKLIESARRFFCTAHNVTYFLFTDQPIEEQPDTVVLPHRRLGWPYDTLFRFHVYDGSKKILEHMDYIFACDADMLFVDAVGDEILGDRVGTQHPGFVGKKGSYEVLNPLSVAYVRPHEGSVYYAGGFYGGVSKEFLLLVSSLKDAVNRDLLQLDFIAVWHDESYLNRYFIDNPPTVTLSPSYCYPESWHLPYKKRLLALDKNHQEYQKRSYTTDEDSAGINPQP